MGAKHGSRGSIWYSVPISRDLLRNRHRRPTPFSGLLRQTKPKTVTVVTDGRDHRSNNENRHDFAERNAEKPVDGAVAGHHTLGPGWHRDAARLRAWFEMPCPDGAST